MALHFDRLRNALAMTVATVLAGTSATAQSLEDVPRDETLVIAHQAESPVFRNVGMANPYSINNEVVRGSILNMFEPLFYYNFNRDELIPWLATDYAYNEDFSEVTINLRDDVTWSDGTPFSADDVAFTFNMLVENGTGARDLVQSAAVADAVQSAEAVDPTTVRIVLSAPDPRFAFKFFINHFDIGLQILPAHIWREVEDPASFNNFDLERGWPVVTGPWRLVRFTDGQIFIDRRDDWWASEAGLADLPSIRRIVTVPGGSRDRMAQLIIAGQVDITSDLQIVDVMEEILARNPNVTTFSGREAPYGSRDWWPTSLYFNHLNPLWSDVRLRRAVNAYVDRDQIIDVVYSGASEPLFTPFPGFGSLQPYIDAALPLAEQHGIGYYDPDRGDELMREAGYTKNEDGFWERDGEVLSATIETISALNSVGVVVAEQLRRAGLDVTFRSTPESRAIMRDGRFDLALFGHRGSISDPFATLDMYTCANALEEGEPTLFLDRWCNEEYDAIVAQVAQMEPGAPELLDAVTDALEIWMREAVEVPISEWYHRIPMNTQYWENWPVQDNPYLQPAFWYTSGQFGYVMQQLSPAE